MKLNAFPKRLCLPMTLAAVSVIVSQSISLASPTPFKDVPKGHWAAASVADLTKKGIIQAKPGGKFNGDKPLTRYEAALYLDRLVHYMESAHKPLYTSTLPAKQIPAIAPGPAHDAMVDLIKNRFIVPTSVLIVAPGTAPVSPREMTDAATQVVVRLEDRRNAPPNPDMDEN